MIELLTVIVALFTLAVLAILGYVLWDAGRVAKQEQRRRFRR